MSMLLKEHFAYVSPDTDLINVLSEIMLRCFGNILELTLLFFPAVKSSELLQILIQ